MPDIESEIRKLNASLEYIKPFVEWTHNYSHTQVLLLKLLSLETKNVLEFWHNGFIQVKFYIPKALSDHIQKYLLETEKFWDIDSLLALEPFIRGKHVLDVGANVGNHSVYWGLVSKVASIQAFEPIPETFGILQRNIKINGLDRMVRVNRCALGSQNGTGDPTSQAENRMQSTVTPRPDALGAIPMRTLDSFRLRNVDFVKIDVEGHTLDMLRGSLHTLSKFRPTIYVELFPHEGNDCREFLESNDYEFVGSIEEYNYIFAHKTKPDEIDALKKVAKGGWPYNAGQ